MAGRPIDRLVTVLFSSSTCAISTTYLLSPIPIRASVLSYYSQYFENILWRSNDTQHTVSAPAQQFSSLRLIINWMKRCQQYGTTLPFPVKNHTYPDLAVMHQAARMLRIHGVEHRLRIRLQTQDLEACQIAELLAKVDVSDFAVQLVIEDLTKKYVKAEAQGDKGWTRKISRLIQEQEHFEFRQAFAAAVREYRQQRPFTKWMSDRIGGRAADIPLRVPGRLPPLELDGDPYRTHLGPGELRVRKTYDGSGEARVEMVRASEQGKFDFSSCEIM